jgi:hypothetical protein
MEMLEIEGLRPGTVLRDYFTELALWDPSR